MSPRNKVRYMISEQYQNLINGYLDGELSEQDIARVTDILRKSAEAQEYYQELLFLRRQISDIPRRTLGADFTRRVIREIDKLPNPSLARHASTTNTFPPSKNDRTLLARLGNWRNWIYPAVAILIAVVVLPRFSLPEKNVLGPHSAPLTNSPISPMPEESSSHTQVTDGTPRTYSPEEISERRTAPVPLARGDSAVSSSFQTISIELNAEKSEQFAFALQRIATDVGITQIDNRMTIDGAVYEMKLPTTAATTFLKKLQSLDFITLGAAFPQELPETNDLIPIRIEIIVTR